MSGCSTKENKTALLDLITDQTLQLDVAIDHNLKEQGHPSFRIFTNLQTWRLSFLENRLENLKSLIELEYG